MNPYEPPKSNVVEDKPKSRTGQNLLGGFCVVFGGLMLLSSVLRLIDLIRLLGKGGTDPQVARMYSDPGYMTGAVTGALLAPVVAILLVRFGIRKLKQEP